MPGGGNEKVSWKLSVTAYGGRGAGATPGHPVRLLPLLLMSCSYNILSPAAEKMEGETPRCSRWGESYTFNCSFHGGVRDEEGRGQSGGREGEAGKGGETASSRWFGFLHEDPLCTSDM